MEGNRVAINSYTALLVDDEPIILRSLSYAIPWDDLQITTVLTAKNGEEALRLFHEHQPDIIISDIRMPTLNGLSLMSEVMKLNENLIFIVISGYGEFEYARESLKHGATGYLLKPIDHDELISMLTKAIDKLKSHREATQQSQQLLDSVHSLSLLARERMFAELIEGNQSTLKHISWLDEYFLQQPYYMMVVQLDHITTFNKHWSTEERKLWLFAVRNILEEWSANNHALAAFPFHSGEWIVFFKDMPIEHKKQLGEDIVQHVRTYSKLSCSVGISSVVQNLEQLHQAYISACDALHQRFYASTEHVFLDQDDTKLDQSEIGGWQYPKWLEKKIIESIRIFDFSATRALLQQLRLELEVGNLSKDSLIRYIVEIAVITRREFEHLQIEIPYSVDQLIQQLMESGTLEEAVTALMQSIEHWITLFERQQHNDEGPALIEKAISYIENQYHNDIGIDEVCEFVGLSVSHFCTLFKQVTGSTFLEYVTRCRIEKAKYMLLNSEVKVYQLAPLVGYQDSKYFTQVFKKMTGMTPSEYRVSEQIS